MKQECWRSMGLPHSALFREQQEDRC